MTVKTAAERIAELEDDNRRLRRLLDQRDAPGELRHRLRSTLALLRAVVRKSVMTERDRHGYAAHLEDRLEAITRAQAFADQTGVVDLRTMLADELLPYGASEGANLLLSGPDVQLQPKAGQVFALAIHELAVNAVEHGALGSKEGKVEVRWSVAETEPDTPMTLTWTDRGPAPAIVGEARSGFGTEVLTLMLAYDLKAETALSFAAGGSTYTVRVPLPSHVGRAIQR